MPDGIMKKNAIKKLLKYFRRRLTLLEKYRDMDLDKEILDCMNEINKLRKKLKELLEDE
jgi:hypothetical protein